VTFGIAVQGGFEQRAQRLDVLQLDGDLQRDADPEVGLHPQHPAGQEAEGAEVLRIAVEDRHGARLQDGAAEAQDLDLLPPFARHHQEVLGAQVAGGDPLGPHCLQAVDDLDQQREHAAGRGAGDLLEAGAVEELGDQEGAAGGREAEVEDPGKGRMVKGLKDAGGGQEAFALLLGLAAVAVDQLDGDRGPGLDVGGSEDAPRVAGGHLLVQPVPLGDPAQLAHR
jgi:hypothetical protein